MGPNFNMMPSWQVYLTMLILISLTVFSISAIVQQILITKKSRYTRGVIHREEMKKIKRKTSIVTLTTLIILFFGFGNYYYIAGTYVVEKADQAQAWLMEKGMQDDKINNKK